MRSFTKQRKVLAVAGVIVAPAVAGGAYAYFTGGGTGSGTATVGTSGAVVLTATVTPGITPGNAEPVSFTAANATTSPIAVTTVHLSGVAVDSGHSGCVTADFTMADVSELTGTAPGLPHQVPGSATADPLPTGGSLVMANTGISQDACKGATLTLSLTSS
ncbi:MAG: hypothetical protein ACR2KV_09165 [Solirubrobacteraceae bacterium]